jgi:hypothetical protein
MAGCRGGFFGLRAINSFKPAQAEACLSDFGGTGSWDHQLNLEFTDSFGANETKLQRSMQHTKIMHPPNYKYQVQTGVCQVHSDGQLRSATDASGKE